MNLRKSAFIIAGLLLAASTQFPYLATVFTAPQYPDRSPRVLIYAHGLGGDVHELQVVGRYIGIKMPPELPEFESGIFTYLILGLALLTIGCGFLGDRWKKPLLVLLVVCGVCLGSWAQYRLHEAGHDLDPRAPLRSAVKPFTPPLVGVVRVHRITIYHLPHAGLLCFAAAVALAAVAGRRPSLGQ